MASRLIKEGAEVRVILTAGAREFVTPLTFQTLTGQPVMQGLFDEVREWKVEHIGAAQWCDCFVVAPATANVLAKFAWGLADDLLSAVWLACCRPKLLAPAMNTAMYEALATRENMAKLRERGVLFAEPGAGILACGDSGRGRLAETGEILDWLAYALEKERPLAGRRVLVTAGPTREDLDPVRYLTNRSSGRMGYAIARAAWLLGGEVTLVSGPVELPLPGWCRVIPVRSAAEMAACRSPGSPGSRADRQICCRSGLQTAKERRAENQKKRQRFDLRAGAHRGYSETAGSGKAGRPGDSRLCGRDPGSVGQCR